MMKNSCLKILQVPNMLKKPVTFQTSLGSRFIVQKTEARIVLSSDWRKQDVLKEGIESAFEEHGIPSLYSSTPDLDQATPGWTLPKACGVVGLGLGWPKKIGFLSCSFL